MERLRLEQIVAQALDMFLREYATGGNFWDEDNFKVNVIAYYAKLVNDAFDDRKQQNKTESGFNQAEISGGWFIEEVVKVEKDDEGYYIKTSAPIFEFVFDGLTSAVHSIIPVGKCDQKFGDLIRVSSKDYWQLTRLPFTSNLYWYFMIDKLRFPTAANMPEKVNIKFLPEMTMDSDCAIYPMPLVTVTITTILQQMFGAKQEMPVVDKSADENENTAAPTELNPDSLK